MGICETRVHEVAWGFLTNLITCELNTVPATTSCESHAKKLFLGQYFYEYEASETQLELAKLADCGSLSWGERSLHENSVEHLVLKIRLLPRSLLRSRLIQKEAHRFQGGKRRKWKSPWSTDTLLDRSRLDHRDLGGFQVSLEAQWH